MYPMEKPKAQLTSDGIVKRSEIWASGVRMHCIQDTFDSSMVRVILGSFGAFPIFGSLVSRKRLVVE